MTNEPQGLIVPFILVEPALFDDDDEPEALTEGLDAFAHWAVSEAFLVSGEFPAEAMWIENLDGYVGQVINGGHTQFVSNTGLNPTTVSNVEACLRAMRASDYLEIFLEFRRRLDASPELAARARKAGSHDWPKDFDDLDDRFYALEKAERLVSRAGRWARGLAVVKPLPFEEIKAERARIIAANAMYGARRDAAERRRAAAETADPLYVAAKTLRAQAGLTFQRFTAFDRGKPPVVLTGGMVTSDGIRFITVQDRRATLLDAARKPTEHSSDCPISWPESSRTWIAVPPAEPQAAPRSAPPPPSGPGPAPRGVLGSLLARLFGRRG
jgi:hypothetical protein